MKLNSSLFSALTSIAVTAATIVPSGGGAIAEVQSARVSNASPTTPAQALQVVAFWREAGPGIWFAKDAAFDRSFRERFLDLHEAASRRELNGWLQTPDGALALIILLDQYPRNAFRNTRRMYSTDTLAREMADAALAKGHDRAVPDDLALFMYLPFGHSESPVDQDRSVALSRRLGQTNVAHAEHHRDIIRRFGRFPHRNPILGRTMRADEQEYLDNGGYRG